MATATRKPLSQDEAKRGALALIGSGSTMEQAASGVGRTKKWLENMRAGDKEYGSQIDAARARLERLKEGGKDPELYDLSFADWRKRFLNQDTYKHQQMWIDALEGKTPKVFHEAITYTRGEPNRLLINTPPYHAKSTTITMQYVTYKLCLNPAYRVIIVSRTAEAASKFLMSIKQYLQDPHYLELQMAYAPPEGWKPRRGEGRWANNLIYLAGRSADAVDAAAKDPSVQAYGIGSQIYGARTDLTILDDAIDDGNAHQYAKQFDWLTRTVLSRGKSAQVLVVGTRIAPHDLYAHLLNPDVYTSGVSPWTHIAQPAVLEFKEEPKDWVTLWPRSSMPLDEASSEEPAADGMFRAWDGPALAKVRADNRPGMWALVYQQQQVSDQMTFHPLCVRGSIDKRRKPGPMRAGEVGGRRVGAEGLHQILSLDPAGTGDSFMMVYGVDRANSERWVQNAWIGHGVKFAWYGDMIEQICPEYGIHELVIEQQGYSSWLYTDQRIVDYCRNRGIRITTSYTGKGNKIDPDFGVSSIAPLFGSLKRRDAGNGEETGVEDFARDNLIRLPDPDYSPGVKGLVDQLLVWVPGASGARLRQDGPMTLWFAEQRARTLLMGGDQQSTHVHNKYLSARAKRAQGIQASAY